MPIGTGINQEMMQQMMSRQYPDMGGMAQMRQQGSGPQMPGAMQQLMQGGLGASQFTMGGVDAYAMGGGGQGEMPSFGTHSPTGDAGSLNPIVQMLQPQEEEDLLAPYQPPQQQGGGMPGMGGGMPGMGGGMPGMGGGMPGMGGGMAGPAFRMPGGGGGPMGGQGP
jgi:hypothetical protein